MSSLGYARITGRVVGPDGEGRVGTVVLQPLDPDWVGALDDTSVVVAHRVTATLSEQGRLTGADGEAGMRVAAPASLPTGTHNYLVTLDVPGDRETPRRYRARILSGTTVDLTDIVAGTAVEDISSPLVRDTGDEMLTATNAPDVVELRDGLLTWRING